jgi:hypothetical protein
VYVVRLGDVKDGSARGFHSLSIDGQRDHRLSP